MEDSRRIYIICLVIPLNTGMDDLILYINISLDASKFQRCETF